MKIIPRNRSILIIEMWLIHINVIYAQFENLKFDTYSTLEGLSSSTCTEIFQDNEGFLWFGTINGLNRYDDYSFVIYRPILNL